MRAVGDRQRETIRPNFDRSICIDFQGAKITSGTGFLLIREIDQRCNVLSGPASQVDDPRSHPHKSDPALRLALGKEHESGAGQSALCRFENKILARGQGLKALESAISRSADTLLRRRNKRRLIIDVDSAEDPVHGKQEGAAFKGYFERVCYHPLFCFTGNGDLLGARLRPGNAHSADGALDLISPLVDRYGLGSSSFGSGAMLHLPVQACMSSAKRSGSLTSFGFPATIA